MGNRRRGQGEVIFKINSHDEINGYIKIMKTMMTPREVVFGERGYYEASYERSSAMFMRICCAYLF